MNKVIEEIAAERRRQIEVEGRTPEHDDQHTDGSLSAVASCYAGCAFGYMDIRLLGGLRTPAHWPLSWHPKWWKPTTPRRDLIKAAALIVAEIERLDRAVAKETDYDK